MFKTRDAQFYSALLRSWEIVQRTTEHSEAVLDALQALHPESSKTTLRKMLESGRVRVNGDVEKNGKRQLRPGDVIDVGQRLAHALLSPLLQLLYEDPFLLVMVKPPGLLTVPTTTGENETVQGLLNDYLRARSRNAHIHVVHRLDRESSGVLVFAKSFVTREKLKTKFAAHDIDRVYVAIIQGAMSPEEGTIKSHLAEDRFYKVRSVEDPSEGKPAVTHYRTERKGSRFSILEVRLETGRKNQIRVHLSEAGHPIIGDKTYGSKVDPIGRLALHARLLGFEHPETGKVLRFEAPVPDDFRSLKL